MVMSGQIELFEREVFAGIEVDELGPRFWRFHEANPHVYSVLKRLALGLAAEGRGRLGMRHLYELARWHWILEADDPSSAFRLNDHYMARYARLLLRDEPSLQGLFILRPLTSRRTD
jgi:hypothetical protein